MRINFEYLESRGLELRWSKDESYVDIFPREPWPQDAIKHFNHACDAIGLSDRDAGEVAELASELSIMSVLRDGNHRIKP